MSAKKSMTTRLFVFTLGMLMTLFFVQSIAAQETRGIIRGTVSDPNGAAVVGATVSIKDVERGRTTTLTTNGDGFYQAPYLIAGKYQVVVEAPGFKKTVNDNVQLQINETLQVNLGLEVGQPVETVTVSSDAAPLATETASLGLVIDQRRIEELPLVKGDPYTLIGAAPGVAHTGSQRLDRPFEPTHIVGYAMDGTRGNRSDLTIDGAPSTSTADPNQVIASYVPPTDIIGEFKVQTATFDAQFGNTEGGVTSISIKSGTNKLHGAAYYFAEPGTWAANDFFGNLRGQDRPTTKSDRFGFSANGPVRIPWLYNGKDKTFFLFGYEGIRDSRPRFDATNIWTPTAALRTGDFSGTGVTIYDPTTRFAGTGTGMGGNGCAIGAFCGTAFPGNIIPDARISPIAKAIMAYYIAPKGPGASAANPTGNLNDSTLVEKTNPYDNFTFRIDQNISDRNHLFVRGSWYNRNSNYNDYLGSEATGVTFIFASRQGVIDDVHTFDPTTFLNVRYAYNRFIRETDQDPDARGFDLTKLGWSNAYNNLIPEEMRRFPRFDFSSPGPLGTGYGNEFRPTDTHSVAATLTKIYNTHSFKFGGEVRVYREDSTFQSNDQTGQFIFNNTFTRQASNGSGTDTNGMQSFAAFLLGLPSTQQIVRRADYSEVSKTWGFFFHDDWKVTRKLTLNMGLRYEIETPMIERQNKSVTGFDPNYVQSMQPSVRNQLIATPVAGADGIAAIDPNTFNVRGALIFASEDRPQLYNTPKDTFLPRFGAAYQINDKLVFRGGFGIFAGFLGQRRGDVVQPGFTETSGIATTTVGGPGTAPIPVNWANFPTALIINEPVGAARGALTGLGGGITFFNQNPEVSKQFRAQVGLQYQLPWGVVAEAVYVYNRGYNIEITRNINAVPNSFLNTDNFRSTNMINRNTALTANVANPFLNQGSFLAGNAFRANATIARSQLLRPFPAFGDINTTNNDGDSWYHSGQFTVSKRMSEGFTIQGAYTWAKWLQSTEYLNAADDRPTKMISDLDVPHRLAISMLYELPFGKGKWVGNDANGVVDRIIGGWQIGAVYAFQTGFPIQFGTDGFFRGGDASIDSKDRKIEQWFNQANFQSFFDWPTFLPANFSTLTPAQQATAITTAQTAANTAATPQSHVRSLPFRFTDLRRDNINNLDFSLLKNIRIKESMKIQIRFELVNALNEPYFPAPAVGPASSGFGTIANSVANQDNYARRAQFGLKFVF